MEKYELYHHGILGQKWGVRCFQNEDGSLTPAEMAALANVAAQYALALDCGAVDPETELPKFLEALEQAGMATYLQAANDQLAAYLAK